ncbi:putative large membrane protein (plasmid) [Streptomyces alboflavus]|uniref:Putative large membrane protein n=1 Tax=Streptomyces alboflavus TaxID=67267 RepID=A0A291W4H2_9ACTN|nr:hypothetical protein [Streptomyces alboflavus]ATM24541.1 putative large membrane protein [Streptomyces alboflavus]
MSTARHHLDQQPTAQARHAASFPERLRPRPARPGATVDTPFDLTAIPVAAPRRPPAADTVRRLLDEAQSLGIDSPTAVLARWRATALIVLRALCPPDDIAWRILHLEAPWHPATAADPRERDQAFADGWSITIGVLEGLLATVPGPDPSPATAPAGLQEQNEDATSSAEPSARIGLALFGAPQVHGATGPAEPRRIARLTEYTIWLHLNPATDRHAMDAALWPDQPTRADSRNTAMSRTRAWLGAAHFPRWTPETGYILAPTVISDWDHFRALTAPDTAVDSPTRTRRLRAALELVQGPPFKNAVGPTRYTWAGPYIQQMTAAIVETARNLTHRYLDQDDPAGARWAVQRGYQALPGGRRQLPTAAESVTEPLIEPDHLRKLADQMAPEPAPLPHIPRQTRIG